MPEASELSDPFDVDAARGGSEDPGVLGRIPPSALLDLNRLATLREVALRGSYSSAADSLHFTPSAVSQQMAGLARDLGSQLFDRTPRGMRLTATGEVLVNHVEAVFARLNAAQGELGAVAGGSRGRLRLGSFPTATVGFLAEAVGVFQDRFAQVDLSLIDGEPYESITRLKNRELDLAVVFDFDHWALSSDFDGRMVCQDSEITCSELFDDPFHVTLPCDHPLVELESLDIAQLAEERILSGPPGCSPWGTDLRELCRRAGFDPVLESRYRTVDFAALQALVATGRGITLIPELALLPAHPGIVTRPLVGGPVRHVRIASLSGVEATVAQRAMVALLQRAVAGRHGAARRTFRPHAAPTPVVICR